MTGVAETLKDEAIGRHKSELDTPALLVDLNILDANIERIAKACRDSNVRWRPHVKAVKCPQIVQRELAAGARGITCAKLGEAEIMAAAGIDDILIANQIVGATKVARLIRLRKNTHVTVAVDNKDNIVALGTAAKDNGTVMPLVIEVDIGMNRAGVLPGKAAVDLAQFIAATPGVAFAGLMSWEAQTVRIEDPTAKVQAIEAAIGALTTTADAIRSTGLDVGIVSCGGTGTYLTAASLPGVTEIQAGGGVFSDICYRRLYHVDHPCALTVMTTVTSRPNPKRIVCDAGKKSLSVETALPEPIGLAGVSAVRPSAEHMTVDLNEPNNDFRLGDKLEFVVGYSDTTVHLHSEIYAVRNGRVEAVWPIVGRGNVR